MTFTSSLNEISTDQLGNRVGGERGKALLYYVLPFSQQASGQIFKDDGKGLSSTSEICFIVNPFIYFPSLKSYFFRAILLVCEI